MRASASVAAIDTAMKLGANHPMGPLELADFIGLDTCLSIMQVLYEGLADSKYRPCPLLVKYVEAGWLGRKPGAASTTIRRPRRSRRAEPLGDRRVLGNRQTRSAIGVRQGRRKDLACKTHWCAAPAGSSAATWSGG